MKTLLCLLALVLLTTSAWAHPSPRISGQINWGQFVNCEMYNDTFKTQIVKNTHYSVTYTNGYIQRYTYACTFGCNVEPYTTKRYAGPQNSGRVLRASCSFEIKKRRHDGRYPAVEQ